MCLSFKTSNTSWCFRHHRAAWSFFCFIVDPLCFLRPGWLVWELDISASTGRIFVIFATDHGNLRSLHHPNATFPPGNSRQCYDITKGQWWVNSPLVRPAISSGGGGSLDFHDAAGQILFDAAPKDLTMKTCGILPWANWNSTKPSSKVSFFVGLVDDVMWVAHINGIDTYNGWLKCMIIDDNCRYILHTWNIWGWCDAVLLCIVCVFFFVVGESSKGKKFKFGKRLEKNAQQYPDAPCRGIFFPCLHVS